MKLISVFMVEDGIERSLDHRTRHDMLDDENAAPRFRAAADRLENLPAFAVVPVVENHLEAIDVCIAGHFFKHVSCHITTAFFKAEPARPQLIPFPDHFRQVEYRARQMRIGGEEGAHHMTVTATDVAPGGD